jgi:hypothetical protein
VIVKIGINALRACVLLALILGILLWTDVLSGGIVMVHMLLGILAVLSLWLLAFGIATAPKGKNIGLAIGAFILGLLLPIIGIGQLSWLPGSAHWVIQIIHLLLGLGAIGIGETISGRYRRMNKAS